MPRFFIPDVSSWQGNLPNFSAVAADPTMVGCIIKSSQGLGPGVRTDLGHSPTWFIDNWPRVAAAGGARYGTSWFRGCYTYGTPASSGTAQADYMLATVERAGGWSFGDMSPAWDLEGKAWTSKQQVIDISSQFAERIKQVLGKAPILYTGVTWRKFKITERAGFGALWSTHMNIMEPYGWPNESYVLWQFVGTGKHYNPATVVLGFPTGVPGFPESTDMNVVVDRGSTNTTIERVREILTGRVAPPDERPQPWVPPQEERLAPREESSRRGRGEMPTPEEPPDRGGALLPLLIGTGLFVAGALIAKHVREDLV